MSEKNRKRFVSLFNDTARYHHRYEVFRDFIMMSGISLHNAVAMSDDLESEYMQIVGRYKKEDVISMSQLLGEVVMGLDTPCDFLGSVFMELDLGSKHLGQCFTPYSVSSLMAELVHGEAIDLFSGSDKSFITLSDPCCGAGGMGIAFADAMLKKGLNPQKQLWISCVDIDHIAAMMCYLQLSLMHIPAEVVTGNTLTLDFSRVMRTPAHHLGLWGSKINQERLTNDDPQAMSTEDDHSNHLLSDNVAMPNGQMSLFDIVT